jgi:hypothetical protein
MCLITVGIMHQKHKARRKAVMDESLVKQILEGTAMVHKTFGGSLKGINEGLRTATFTVSTGAVDRDNDTIAPDGWDLKDYKKNPVVLWAHNPSIPPIGKSSGTSVKDGALVSTATFAAKEVHELADTVFRLIQVHIWKKSCRLTCPGLQMPTYR